MTLPFGPPPFARKPSIVDRIAQRLFPTASLTGLLDPGQAEGLSRQELLNVGLNLLQAGGRSAHQQGTLANIGSSIQGVNFPEMAQHAMQLQAYKSHQAEQQALAQAVARHPAKPGETREQTYGRFTEILTDIASLPGGAAVADKWAPLLTALKPEKPDRARWSFQTIMENGEPQLYRINEDTGVKYRVGMAKPAASTNSVTANETRAAAQNAIAALDDADAALKADPNADIQPTASSIARGAKSIPLVGGALSGALEPIAQSQMSPAQKQFQQAMDQFLHNYASLLPRGGRSVAILQNLRDSFAPKPGQTDAQTRAAFTQARAHLRRSMEALARGESPSATPEGTAPVSPAAPSLQAPAVPVAPAVNPRWWRQP